MGEIATWAMIHAKIPSSPAPTSGRENECLTKNEILNQGGGDTYVEGSYGDSECVIIDDISRVTGTYIGTLTSYMDGVADDPVYGQSFPVAANNNIARLSFLDVWFSFMALGDITVKATVENGQLKNVISVSSDISFSFDDFRITGSFVSGNSCNIDFVCNFNTIPLRVVFSGTK